MPEDELENEEEEDSQEQESSSGQQYGGGGHKIVVGTDDSGTGLDQQNMEDLAQGLKDCGNEVEITTVDPNQEGIMAGNGADFNVFICNGVGAATIWSFFEAVKSGRVSFTIFAFAGWLAEYNDTLESEQSCREVEFTPEKDAGQFMTGASTSDMQAASGGAKTVGEFFDNNSQYLSMCWASSAEEMAQKICSGACGGGSSTQVQQQGASAILIEDKTFYGLIKQMMGAVDAVFIIANNMAYLLSFKDIYEYRNLYDEYIPKIESKDVIYDTLLKNWTTDGFYNAVEVTYADGIIKYQNDVLVKQYGEHVFYYEFPEDDEETAKAKADALLAAHIRDYSSDIQMSIFYNPNITVGSWVKVNKTITNISGKTLREAKQEELKEKGETIETKRKGITIENLIEKTITEDGITKTIQTITDADGDIFDIEIEKDEYELFFVNGYTCRWDKENSLIMDIELKYGPDTPQDPINATIGVGGQVATSNGQWGNDCFGIDEICVSNSKKLTYHYSGGAEVETVKGMVNSTDQPDEGNLRARAAQGSTYANKCAGKSAAEVYAMFRTEYDYGWYADNAPCWSCASDFYDNAGKIANCGDTACLLKVFYDSIGVPCTGVHIDGHYFNAIQIDGEWEIIDGVRINNQTCGFPDGSGYNPYGHGLSPCTSYTGNQSSE